MRCLNILDLWRDPSFRRKGFWLAGGGVVGLCVLGLFFVTADSRQRQENVRKAIVQIARYVKQSHRLEVDTPSDCLFCSKKRTLRSGMAYLEKFLKDSPRLKMTYSAECFPCAEDANEIAKIINITGAWRVDSVSSSMNDKSRQGITIEKIVPASSKEDAAKDDPFADEDSASQKKSSLFIELITPSKAEKAEAPR